MSGFAQMPSKKDEKRLSDLKSMVYSLLGKIYLTKPTFFGLDSNQIILVVSPTLKVLHVGATKNKLLNNFPLKVDDRLDGDKLIDWANQNDYVISFDAPTPKLNRKLYYQFSNVLNENKNTKTFKDYINESKLPIFIKNKALDDEDWFKSNINEIFKKIK